LNVANVFRFTDGAPLFTNDARYVRKPAVRSGVYRHLG
jgi:hypothetical protein